MGHKDFSREYTSSMELLRAIEKRRIGVDNALNMLRNTSDERKEKGNFIKIDIEDESGKRNFSMPMILVGSGVSIYSLASTFNTKKENQELISKLKFFDRLSRDDMRLLVNALRECKDQVFIKFQGKDSIVNISIV